MSDAAPPDIRRFEALQITSIVIGLINQFAASRDGLLNDVIGQVLILVLTLQVSRRRKNWARWVLFLMVVLGLAIIFWKPALVMGLSSPALSLTIAVTVLQAVALFLLFTGQSSSWLRHRPNIALR